MLAASDEKYEPKDELSMFMKVKFDNGWSRMITVDCEIMEEGESEEDLSEQQLLSLAINFFNLFFLRIKISLVSVRIIRGISVVMRRGDSKSTTSRKEYMH